MTYTASSACKTDENVQQWSVPRLANRNDVCHGKTREQGKDRLPGENFRPCRSNLNVGGDHRGEIFRDSRDYNTEPTTSNILKKK